MLRLCSEQNLLKVLIDKVIENDKVIVAIPFILFDTRALSNIDEIQVFRIYKNEISKIFLRNSFEETIKTIYFDVVNF